MRRFELALPAVAATLTVTCAVPLPGGDLGQPAAKPDAGSVPLPVARGCAPFHSVAGVDLVSGAVRSLPRAGGGALLVVDDAVVRGADIPSLAFAVPAGATIDDCFSAATVGLGMPSPALDPTTLSPLSGALVGGTSLLYYVDPTGSIGVATQDPSDGRFRPTSMPIWTFDRPSYGAAAVIDGADVDVLGCRSARFLDTDCFMARAPAASVADESAYTYYIGGGIFSPRVDDAWPMTTGPSSMDVAPVGARWLMAYVPPLGSMITLRSGLMPEGPWSAPIAVATCDLADADMFCSGIHLHPVLAAPSGAITLSYAPAILTPGAGARRAAQPDKWWPRFVTIVLPALP
jgi:hypothetical protein